MTSWEIRRNREALHSPKGSVIYVYEGIVPHVSAGAFVEAGDVIGMGGITGSIEIGFANKNGEPLAAPEYAGKEDGTETKHGKEMRAFLMSIGVS